MPAAHSVPRGESLRIPIFEFPDGECISHRDRPRSPQFLALRSFTQIDLAARAWTFMRTPKTNCDMKSVDLAYNRFHNGSEPRGCAA
jgi:hypothetical protein